MRRLVDLTPLIPSADVVAAAAFYRDVLGFRAGVVDPDYAYLKRDEVAVRIVPVEDAQQGAHVANRLAVYVDVADVDALYAELQPKLAALSEGRVRPPFNQPYGMREFHVKDEDGMLIFFGEDSSAR